MINTEYFLVSLYRPKTEKDRPHLFKFGKKKLVPEHIFTTSRFYPNGKNFKFIDRPLAFFYENNDLKIGGPVLVGEPLTT